LTGDDVKMRFRTDKNSGYGAATAFSWERADLERPTIDGDDLVSLNHKEGG
jgi:hypothetical protein